MARRARRTGHRIASKALRLPQRARCHPGVPDPPPPLVCAPLVPAGTFAVVVQRDSAVSLAQRRKPTPEQRTPTGMHRSGRLLPGPAPAATSRRRAPEGCKFTIRPVSWRDEVWVDHGRGGPNAGCFVIVGGLLRPVGWARHRTPGASRSGCFAPGPQGRGRRSAAMSGFVTQPPVVVAGARCVPDPRAEADVARPRREPGGDPSVRHRLPVRSARLTAATCGRARTLSRCCGWCSLLLRFGVLG